MEEEEFKCPCHGIYSEEFGIVDVGEYDFEDPEFHNSMKDLAEIYGTVHLVNLRGRKLIDFHSKYMVEGTKDD